MKILCLLGSPRYDGNSSQIARRFISTAEELGAEVKVYELNKLNFKGCQGCASCKTKTDYCATKDDLTGVLEGIKDTDVFLLSTPVYFAEVPGQVKCFTDRLYSFFPPNYIQPGAVPRISPGKKVVLITTQGAPETAMKEVSDRYSALLKRMLGASEVHALRAGGVGGGGIPKIVPEHYLKQAEELAKQIMAK